MSSIKYKNKNFLWLYHYLTGQSEIPRGYHGWASLSLIAALAEKRVWFEKFKGSKLYPNIYTLLIGPSGIGKGGAIGHAMRILKAADLDPPLNIYRGSTTHAHLEDVLGKPIIVEDEYVYPPSQLWLIMDELANNLGDTKLAERFIKMMTELFTGDYDISGGTRTHGSRKIESPCVNWFAGTTVDWLFDAISRKEVFSGFTARVFFCFRKFIDTRHAQPSVPDNYDDVLGRLINKIRAIHLTEGPFCFADKTQAIKDKWYMTRPVPKDEGMLAAWKRGDDLVIKLCMIFSLADSTDLIIKPHHFMRAKSTFDNAFNDLDQLMDLACGTKDKEEVQFIEKVLKTEKKLNRTLLGKIAYKKGILAPRLDVIIKDIESRGRVVIRKTKTGAQIYEYAG